MIDRRPKWMLNAQQKLSVVVQQKLEFIARGTLLVMPCGGADLRYVIWNNSDEIELQNLPAIDWANVNWLYVAVLAVFVFS
jgi:hypothetical protein